MKPLITNIQRFSLHDGPGIRTTVFFKGCSLHCPWCANPENISGEEETYFIPEKCNPKCVHIAECSKKLYPTECVYKAVGLWGKCYSEQELYDILTRDKSSYDENGGVTFSGGEPLLFLHKYYSNLCRWLHREGISLCIETSLFASNEAAKWMTEVIDYIYIDIKILDSSKCNIYLGGNLEQYMKNVKTVYENKGNKKLIYRIPLIHGYTDSVENLENICTLLKKYPSYRVEVLKAHNLGKKKYERLGKEYTDFVPPNDDRVRLFVDRIEGQGIQVEIKQV